MEVKFRNRYLLVAVRSPDHHGLFVDDLAGGDGTLIFLDVLDLGNGLHGVTLSVYSAKYEGVENAFNLQPLFFLFFLFLSSSSLRTSLRTNFFYFLSTWPPLLSFISRR